MHVAKLSQWLSMKSSVIWWLALDIIHTYARTYARTHIPSTCDTVEWRLDSHSDNWFRTAIQNLQVRMHLSTFCFCWMRVPRTFNNATAIFRFKCHSKYQNLFESFEIENMHAQRYVNKTQQKILSNEILIVWSGKWHRSRQTSSIQIFFVSHSLIVKYVETKI